MMYKCNLEKDGRVIWCGYFHKPATLVDIADALCTDAKEWLERSMTLAATPNPEGWLVDAHHNNEELSRQASNQAIWFLDKANDIVNHGSVYEVFHQEVKVYGDK